MASEQASEIVAVQVFDGNVVAEWNAEEWAYELADMLRKNRKLTLEELYGMGIRETDKMHGKLM